MARAFSRHAVSLSSGPGSSMAGPERPGFSPTAAKSHATPCTRRCGKSCTGTSASAASKQGEHSRDEHPLGQGEPSPGQGEHPRPGPTSPGQGEHPGLTASLSLRFLETVELQISLKNYDPQKDKRFSGTVRLAPL